jgi:oligoribonuclease NrnB/cAMP/cGMP phosphodiesterase (DHH superfamily)
VTKPYILYHALCRDGFGAAWAAHQRFGTHAQYRAVRYGEPFPADAGGKQVYCFDFSYPPAELERALTDVKPAAVEIHDHHDSAMKTVMPWYDTVYEAKAAEWPPLVAHFDNDRSGAVLAWMRLHPGEAVPPLLRYVEDRDLWSWKLPASRQVSAWIETHATLFHVWDELDSVLGRLPVAVDADVPHQVRVEGDAILRYQYQLTERLSESPRWVEFDGCVVPVVNTPVLQSEVGEALCLNHPEAPFAMTYYERQDGQREWSLRSRGGCDVAQVAGRMGGGGHPAAAGFRTPAGELPAGMLARD